MPKLRQSEEEKIYENLKINIEFLKAKNNMKKSDIAKIARFTRPTLNSREEKPQFWTLKELISLSKAFRIPLYKLFLTPEEMISKEVKQ